jgi:WD40 repeat protein
VFRFLVCCLPALLLPASSAFGVGPPLSRTDHLGDPLPHRAVARLGTLRFCHGEPINAVAISPDGRMIASSSGWVTDEPADGFDGLISRIILWEAKSGKRLREIHFPIERVVSLAFSPDGRVLAAAANSVALYETSTGKQVHRWTGSADGKGCSVQFLPDGKTLAVIENEDRIHFHDLRTGRRVRLLEADKPKPAVLKNGDQVEERHHPMLSPDGKVAGWFVVKWTMKKGGQNEKVEHRIKLCCAETGKVRCSIPGPFDDPFAFDRTGALLAVSRVHAVEIRDTRTGAKRRLVEHEVPGLTALALSPDGKTLAAVSGEGGLRLWNVGTGKPFQPPTLPDLSENVGGPFPMVFSADGRSLVIDCGRRVVVIDPATGKQLQPTTLPPGTTHGVRFTPDGRSLLSGEFIKVKQPPDEYGKSPSSGEFIKSTQLWDATTWKRRKGWRPSSVIENLEQVLVMAPDGNLLVNPREGEKDTRLIDTRTGKTLRVFAGVEKVIEARFSSNGRAVLLLRGYETEELLTSIHDPRTGKLLRKVNLDPNADPFLSPCGRVIAWLSEEGEVRLLNVGTGKQSRLSNSTGGKDLVALWFLFSPDSERVAVFSWSAQIPRALGSRGDVTVCVTHVATGKPLGRWVMPDLGPDCRLESTTVAFSADGRTLITAHRDDRDVCLWDVTTGKRRGRLRGHRGEILSLAVSPDGRHLASGSADNTILVWDLQKAFGPSGFFKDPLGDKELQRLWSELGDKDPVRAGAAVAALAAAPRDGVPFLRRRLQPARAPSAKEFSELIRQLDSPDFATREKAHRRLAECGDAVENGLLRARQKKLDFELHQRIGRLLEVCRNPANSADRLRELRAVEVLERIGDRDAREFLRALVKGAPEARLTLEAKGALRRVGPKAD